MEHRLVGIGTSQFFSVTSRAFDRNWTKTEGGEMAQLPLAGCPLITFFTGQNLFCYHSDIRGRK